MEEEHVADPPVPAMPMPVPTCPGSELRSEGLPPDAFLMGRMGRAASTVRR
jgi:hypothetical protein